MLCVGRKARDMLRRELGGLVVGTVEGVGRRRLEYAEAVQIAERIASDVRGRRVRRLHDRLQPLPLGDQPDRDVQAADPGAARAAAGRCRGRARSQAVYEFEPDEEAILKELLPRNLAVQIYGALVENAASEQGARMTAMDNATRNAGEMIQSLTLTYNRTRQAQITKELIEIVSGAEAL